MAISLEYSFILVSLGVIAGIINTLAGGGSNLTLPALMVMGMPADVANATNRVAVWLQCASGMSGFRQHDKLDTQDIIPVLIPNLIGGLCGALAAAWLPTSWVKPLLLGTLLTMTVVMLVKPATFGPPAGTPVKKVADTPTAWFGLMLAGFYGGFVQAGVGFVLLAALCGTLHYDLVRGNALKLACTLAFTSLSLLVFIADDLVRWAPGLILAIGTMVGARIAVRFAISANPKLLKLFLFVMTLVGCLAAYLF
ncbi:permease [Salinivibrio sp. MA427]|uniref:sulfite exporter TauE/SafE family protein n=1 Tax=unclassified Salinivibrio TaxID=2636825 RepID=UPI0009874C3C|nr:MULTISPECIES: sulfite exporter TauE/SafE family protein [unclassified Salinivibrio]OOE93362.1 permease [Salinivibrio sp. AR647]OOF10528.1 permease [Salinivibrio sp. MA427]